MEFWSGLMNIPLKTCKQVVQQSPIPSEVQKNERIWQGINVIINDKNNNYEK